MADGTRIQLEPGAWLDVLELVPDAITITRLGDGCMLMANAAAAQMYGWAREEMIGHTTLELGLFKESRARAAMVDLLRDEGRYQDYESEFWYRGSEPRTGVFSGRLLEFIGVPSLLVIGRDITQARQQQLALRESEGRFRMLVESTLDIPWQLNGKGVVEYIGPGVGRLGYASEALIGKPILDIVHPEDREAVRERLSLRSRGESVPSYFRVRLRDTRGEYHVFENNTAPVEDAHGRIIGSHGIARDVSEHVALERRLYDMAHRDPLTALLNRQGFFLELERALQIQQCISEAEFNLAFLFVDLDDFKKVNDSAGHVVGDACLQAIASAMQRVLRATDRAGRIGGDEFAVLLTPVSAEHAVSVAERMLGLFENLNKGIELCPLPLTASVGICMARPGDDPDDLLAKADAAMYKAKADGKNRVGVYHVSGDTDAGAVHPEDV